MSATSAKLDSNHIDETQVLWKAVRNLKESFKLDEQETMHVLGHMPQSSFYRGMKSGNVKFDHDRTMRISLLLGIYKALRILFTDGQQGMTWINRPNQLPPFNGEMPRTFIVSGDYTNLVQVRQFLDYWRG